MNKVVGIRFKRYGKVYQFDSGHFVLNKGDKVMVVTSEGPAIGEVCTDRQNRQVQSPQRALKKVFRLATDTTMSGNCSYDRTGEVNRHKFVRMALEEGAGINDVLREAKFEESISKLVYRARSEGAGLWERLRSSLKFTS